MIENQEALAEIERKTGPSNFFRALSHRGDAMRHVAELYDSVMGSGALNERLKDMIYFAVSTVNECDYCTIRHEARARRAGLSEDELQDLRAETDYHFDEQERAALRYARELTRTAAAEHETRDLIDRLFEADQKVELTLVVALANFTNRISTGLKIPVEKEKHRAA